jgi:hypothetical protein
MEPSHVTMGSPEILEARANLKTWDPSVNTNSNDVAGKHLMYIDIHTNNLFNHL